MIPADNDGDQARSDSREQLVVLITSSPGGEVMGYNFHRGLSRPKLPMIETIATVERNEELAPGFRLLVLAFETPIEIRPGQFAMLKAHPTEEALLRRALAVYKVNGPRTLSFLYQVVGRGTRALSHLGPGRPVEALLPLGNSWPTPG